MAKSPFEIVWAARRRLTPSRQPCSSASPRASKPSWCWSVREAVPGWRLLRGLGARRAVDRGRSKMTPSVVPPLRAVLLDTGGIRIRTSHAELALRHSCVAQTDSEAERPTSTSGMAVANTNSEAAIRGLDVGAVVVDSGARSNLYGARRIRTACLPVSRGAAGRASPEETSAPQRIRS
jgi:hypothetical protein